MCDAKRLRDYKCVWRVLKEDRALAWRNEATGAEGLLQRNAQKSFMTFYPKPNGLSNVEQQHVTPIRPFC